ncbi:hypothetical protein [Amaricoccus solimangrovi]|uniref:Uncharacterized protein n=1 Tax=Amaricoccus solimangrovi TaxID=2589815 RepID=A0A501WHG3_9RHOB|nr:hypothetical protein [Amaricoccus solimangrovi]TPE47875.1 hypothetical protein FJM51_19250 [Amaricoccus solimangrovi]
MSGTDMHSQQDNETFRARYRTDDDAVTFLRLFPERGHAVELAHDLSELRRQADHAMRIAAGYWPRDFAESCGFDYRCFVYDRYAPNAFAAFREGRHWIGLSSGLVYVIAELAVRAAAAADIPGSSPCAAEPDAHRGFGFRFSDEAFRGGQEETARFFRQTQDFDQARMRVMNAIWLDAQTLVWRHEFFHASLGHTRFADHALGLGALDEDAAPPDNPDGFEILRAMEFHADWAGFGSMIKASRSGLDPVGSDLVKRFGLRFRVAVMTAAVLLLPLFFRVAEDHAPSTARTHPHAATRLQIFLLRVSDIDEPNERGIWEAGALDAIGWLVSYARRNSEFSAIAGMLDDATWKVANRERQRCIDVFDALQEVLGPYAVLPLGHPHQGDIAPIPTDSDGA